MKWQPHKNVPDRKLSDVRIRFVESVNKAVISTLLDDLLERRVLNEEEVEEVKESCSKKSDQARCLIDGVRKKGAKASEIFIERLCVRDVHLATELGLSAPSGSAAETQQVPSQEWIQPCPREFVQRIQKEEAKEIYSIRDKATRTRLALIICNVEFERLRRRDGADVDVKGMKKLLEGLGYKVETYCNLNAQAMAETLKQFAARNEHQTSDSTFLVLMSHGVRDGLCGTNCQDESTDILSTDTIYSTFNNQNCQALLGKPKVIIIQACRGENRGQVWVSDSAELPGDGSSLARLPPEGLEDDASFRIHVESDFICLHSTTPNTSSWRSPETGSIFITRLIEQFRTNACRLPLEEIFRQVQLSFQDFPLQMPTKERTTMIKKFYLFPGH
ncbi:caspase-1-like isoform X1 [Chelonoidis abingdonii]|uniref:caspase-1-like isoform X1 n=1 Tax=Chelonoidis abingdonii TaxID=106734 RepID=UPI0013F25C9A|nr:caspase-1-like isoform X1 [Chelonoidis abingdonii]XP_032625787.1 caspase-1-like isoform X1 [Chelonoidis abingdonii]XP_032625789.1 caspase-1-like isoform X1 [Chelonoidis abingdonii]XP_032625790.1 caspase-1-like isoform X1 [Chelonoidis abingdonii]